MLLAPFSRKQFILEFVMNDIIFVTVGLGAFALLAVYARNLGRI